MSFEDEWLDAIVVPEAVIGRCRVPQLVAVHRVGHWYGRRLHASHRHLQVAVHGT
jgi:hypothetical protein